MGLFSQRSWMRCVSLVALYILSVGWGFAGNDKQDTFGFVFTDDTSCLSVLIMFTVAVMQHHDQKYLG